MEITILFTLLLISLPLNYAQSFGTTFVRYCMIQYPNLHYRLFNIDQWSDFNPTNGYNLVTGSTYTAYNCLESEYCGSCSYGQQLPNSYINIAYGDTPCILGYSVSVENSYPICEVETTSGYYYFNCQDYVAIFNVVNYAMSNVTFLGWFQSEFNYDLSFFWSTQGRYGPPYYETANVPTFMFNSPNGNIGSTVDILATLCYTTPTDFPTLLETCFDGVSPAWSILFFGLPDYPTIQQGDTNLLGTEIGIYTQNNYTIDNCNNKYAFTFGLSNLLTSTTTTSYTINYATSSSSVSTHGISFTESSSLNIGSDVFGKSSLTFSSTQTSQIQDTYTQSSSTTQNSQYTVTDTITITGSLSVQPNTKIIITENIVSTINSYAYNFLLNNAANQINYDQIILEPNGYIVYDVSC